MSRLPGMSQRFTYNGGAVKKSVSIIMLKGLQGRALSISGSDRLILACMLFPVQNPAKLGCSGYDMGRLVAALPSGITASPENC